MKTHLYIPFLTAAAALLLASTTPGIAASGSLGIITDADHTADLEAKVQQHSSLEQKLQTIREERLTTEGAKAKVAAKLIINAPQGKAPEVAALAVVSLPDVQPALIATEVGSAFAERPALAKQAPELAASMVKAIYAKEEPNSRVGEIAETVAVICVLLPGNIGANQVQLLAVARAVDAVIPHPHPNSLVPAIVGVTGTALRAIAGTADIRIPLSEFANEFKHMTASEIPRDFKDFKNAQPPTYGSGRIVDLNEAARIDRVVGDVLAGQDFHLLPNYDHYGLPGAPLPTVTNPGIKRPPTGPIDPPETPYQNN